MRMKTCKQCRVRFEPVRQMQVCCSMGCATDYGRKMTAIKSAKEALAERKVIRAKREAMKGRAQWMREAQKAVNAYIRIRDDKEPCISCGRYHEGQWHAGHYRSTGSSPSLRFDLSNIHKQCQPCNTHLHGNLIPYRVNLIQKIGIDEVERLEGPQDAKKYSIDDLKQIIATYKQKAKELKNG